MSCSTWGRPAERGSLGWASPGLAAKIREESVHRPGKAKFVHSFALPDDSHAKSQSLQLRLHAPIASTVCRELLHPEFPIPLRHGGADTVRVCVPEASMNENCPMLAPVCEIGRAR